MAVNKNKIIVYRDWMSTFEALSDEEAGMLIKHFFRYVNDKNPEAPNRLIGLVFEPIKQTLKRDLRTYEETCNKNRKNINLRWNKINTNDTTVYDRIRTDTNHTDNDNDSDSDSDNDSKIKKTNKRKQKNFIPPTLEQVKKYFADNGYLTSIAERAFNYYASAEWFDSEGKPVRNWKQKMIMIWFKDEYKVKVNNGNPVLVR